jgi:hypothetical protein
MVDFENTKTTINFSGVKIDGWLSGSFDKWHFKSSDPFFLRHCPAGIIRSNANYRVIQDRDMGKLLFHAISIKVAAIRNGESQNASR